MKQIEQNQEIFDKLTTEYEQKHLDITNKLDYYEKLTAIKDEETSTLRQSVSKLQSTADEMTKTIESYKSEIGDAKHNAVKKLAEYEVLEKNTAQRIQFMHTKIVSWKQKCDDLVEQNKT